MRNPPEESKKYYPSNLEELKRVITEVWASVSSEACRDLICSLPERMKEIVNAEDATTKYRVY